MEIAASFPAVAVRDAGSDLWVAIAGEHATWTVRYPDFAQTAREEGFPEIADVSRRIAASEEPHENIFSTILMGLEKRLD